MQMQILKVSGAKKFLPPFTPRKSASPHYLPIEKKPTIIHDCNILIRGVFFVFLAVFTGCGNNSCSRPEQPAGDNSTSQVDEDYCKFEDWEYHSYIEKIQGMFCQRGLKPERYWIVLGFGCLGEEGFESVLLCQGELYAAEGEKKEEREWKVKFYGPLKSPFLLGHAKEIIALAQRFGPDIPIGNTSGETGIYVYDNGRQLCWTTAVDSYSLELIATGKMRQCSEEEYNSGFSENDAMPAKKIEELRFLAYWLDQTETLFRTIRTETQPDAEPADNPPP